MRIKPLLAITATLLAITACGSGDSGVGSIGGNLAEGGAGAGAAQPGKGPEPQGLIKAGSMAEAGRIVGRYAECARVSTTKEGSAPGTGPNDKYGASYSVTERGYCNDSDGTSILLFKDAKAFQTAVKADADKEYAENRDGQRNMGVVIGQDFATGSESTDVMASMLSAKSGMLVLNCHPAFNPPSGYRKDPALVKGCVLTNYLSEE
ncbi:MULTISPECIES: hypothetical protein [unclassified Streptomyces]|uniref:hypothetical protein n=1 Tax=unclassified Streptomyces TaxID=2593676 RepID=UPI0022512643|nr:MULTISPECIES: hypothetical protein [unclassified Streptomyces]MCX4526394.1 hypothetical protein [Streptomyces sp. NBC_01551]MCX4543043.1 hypothetical protein [Streptomyces sp. NBC_01565]